MSIEYRLSELKSLCKEEHEQCCDCVFTIEEIERLVDLTKEPSYVIPRGLPREERRKYIEDAGEDRPKYLLTKEQVRKIGELSLSKYAETKPTDFKPHQFLDLYGDV